MEQLCPNCNDLRPVELIEKAEDFPVKKDKLTIMAKLLRCRECSTEFSTFDIEEKNFKTAYAIYRANHNLLIPGEMTRIREMYGLSQRAFARLLGWSDTIINQYEKGRLQDRAHNDELMLLKNPNCMRELLSNNEINLSDSERQVIRERLEVLIKIETEGAWRKMFCDFPVDEFTGDLKFNFDKFKQMILILLQLNGGLLKVKLNKLAFYSDFLHYSMYSSSISGSRYRRIRYGPVSSDYEHYLAKMQSEGLIKIKEIPYPEGYVGEKYICVMDTNYEMFSSYEIKIMEYVSNFFSGFNSTDMSNYSHEDPAVIGTSEGDLISYKNAKKIKLPLPE